MYSVFRLFSTVKSFLFFIDKIPLFLMRQGLVYSSPCNFSSTKQSKSFSEFKFAALPLDKILILSLALAADVRVAVATWLPLNGVLVEFCSLPFLACIVESRCCFLLACNSLPHSCDEPSFGCCCECDKRWKGASKFASKWSNGRFREPAETAAALAAVLRPPERGVDEDRFSIRLSASMWGLVSPLFDEVACSDELDDELDELDEEELVGGVFISK